MSARHRPLNADRPNNPTERLTARADGAWENHRRDVDPRDGTADEPERSQPMATDRIVYVKSADVRVGDKILGYGTVTEQTGTATDGLPRWTTDTGYDGLHFPAKPNSPIEDYMVPLVLAAVDAETAVQIQALLLEDERLRAENDQLRAALAAFAHKVQSVFGCLIGDLDGLRDDMLDEYDEWLDARPAVPVAEWVKVSDDVVVDEREADAVVERICGGARAGETQ